MSLTERIRRELDFAGDCYVTVDVRGRGVRHTLVDHIVLSGGKLTFHPVNSKGEDSGRHHIDPGYRLAFYEREGYRIIPKSQVVRIMEAA